MKPFTQCPPVIRNRIRYVLTDIDDTLTCEGRLVAAAYSAMERLTAAGQSVVPITGRPAGWCDHIARMWPVDAVVGENGAFYFSYDRRKKKMRRVFWKSDSEREKDREALNRLRKHILETIPGCRVSADQAYREADLAIDFCEDVPALPMEAVDGIVRCFAEAGAQAKISSIHVNGWFGSYDKLSMTRRLFEDLFLADLDEVRDRTVFCGDSPNDAPMFAYFPHAVGVANIRRFMDRVSSLPAWVTEREGGEGFAEMADGLLG